MATDSVMSFEEFFADSSNSNPSWTMEEAREAYRQLPEDERYPEDGDPFSLESAGGGLFYDGDWPTWPAQEMLRWLPAAVRKRFGTVADSVINGALLRLDAERKSEIVAALEGLGHRCIRDDDLINRISP